MYFTPFGLFAASLLLQPQASRARRNVRSRYVSALILAFCDNVGNHKVGIDRTAVDDIVYRSAFSPGVSGVIHMLVAMRVVPVDGRRIGRQAEQQDSRVLVPAGGTSRPEDHVLYDEV